MRKPKKSQSKTQTIKRSRSNLAPLSDAMAKCVQEPGTQFRKRRMEKGEQERINQPCNGKEFETGIPLEKPGTFKSEFRFVIAQRHFNLPAASISENDFPGESRGMSRFRGEQVPGRLAFAASDHEPERLVMSAIENGESDDPGFTFTATAGIPNQTVTQERLALLSSPGFLSCSYSSRSW